MSVRFAVLCALLPAAIAAPPAVHLEVAQHDIVHQDFEQDPGGWVAVGPDSTRVHITHDPAQVKNGKGALEIDYDASAAKPGAAALPIKQTLAHMQSLCLWLMTESATAAAVSLNEHPGGRYVAVVWLQPHIWQRVELAPEDFVLAQNPDDPQDPDGKLDLDQVDAVGLLDVSQILNVSSREHNARLALVTHTGPRKLFADDFEVSAERPAWFHARRRFEIDSFEHPQLDWFTLGGPDLERDTSQKILSGNALKASYEQMENAYVVILHPLPAMDFTGATHLAFDVASDIDAHLLFLLEQVVPRQTRFHANIEVKGGGAVEHREIPLSAFQLGEENTAAVKLDLTKLKVVGFVDISSAFSEGTAANTLRIGNIRMVTNPGLEKSGPAQ